jgi:hypothetical protein
VGHAGPSDRGSDERTAEVSVVPLPRMHPHMGCILLS